MSKNWITFLSAMFVIISIFSNYASGEESISAYDALQLSVHSLKDSIRQLKNKNQSLQQSNQQSQNDIEGWRHELYAQQPAFQKKIKDGFSKTVDSEKEKFLLKQRAAGLYKTLAELEKESEAIQQRMDSREQTIQLVQQKIQAVNEEESSWQNKIASYESTSPNQAMESQRRQLMEAKNDHEQRLRDLSALYDKRFGKTQGEFGEFHLLREKHSNLHDTFTALQSEMAQLDQKQAEIKDDLARLEKEQSELAPNLTQNVETLQTRHQDLQKVLEEAKARLNNKKLDAAGYDPERQELLKNLNVLREENCKLKDQFISLQKTVQDSYPYR